MGNVVKNFPRDYHGILALLYENPRIAKRRIAEILGINEKTAADWLDIAFRHRIIIPPVLRRRAFLNFGEHLYFLRVDDPYETFERLRKSKDITYYAVLTGFANFEIIANGPIDPPGEIVFSGRRSDYFVPPPPKVGFDESVVNLRKQLSYLRRPRTKDSPLMYHDTVYEPWDEEDELLYWEFKDDVRLKKLTWVMKETLISSTKVLGWFRRMKDFGTVITMFFPGGEEAYLPAIFVIKTEYDQVLIDLFSKLPASTVFYRLNDYLVMILYLPFSAAVTMFVREALNKMRRERLIEAYNNANIEFHHRS